MENLNNIAKLLGEENEKRLKNAITNLIIEHIDDELSDYDRYLIDWDNLLYDVRNDVEQRIKDRVFNMYMNQAEKKLEKFFEENPV